MVVHGSQIHVFLEALDRLVISLLLDKDTVHRKK